ncbi:WYL domain-containing protein [Geomonas nitrogeniifigens]|uniref:helix-turn-helix transcriptional regulator n=1 Tax=Geomonas diazotrophica TaxID=2843197 RepID=UPI001C2C8BC5|nr:WYL domain-containing transcriptional regulator [Geomonas nitrogeniifigens]QXE87347.1 WYL domain-containing protein [Geomonas nitrogeniifigens]
MKTMYRRMQILSMIPRSGTITTQQIEERLGARGVEGISRRMIQRDLEAIHSSGYFPIRYEEDGQTYYWSWVDGAQILRVGAMEPHTALTYCLVNKRMPNILPSSSHRYLDPYFRSAQALLDDQSELPVSRWRAKVRTIPRSLQMTPPKMDDQVTDTVYEAVLRERRLSLRYRPRGESAAKEYPWVNPLALVFVDSLVYLVATIKGYGNPVQFLLHRIESAASRDEPALIPEGFSLQAYIESGEFSYPVGDTIISLKALFERGAAAYLYDTPLPGTRRLEGFDAKRVLLEAEVLDSLQLRWWLRGFGEDVEVLEPAELRSEFQKAAASMSRRYKGKVAALE